MNKKGLLQHLKLEVFCRLKVGRFGVGIFAIKNIPKNTDVFINSRRKYISISRSEIEEQNTDSEVIKMLEDFFVEKKGIFYIPEKGFSDVDISFYLNHSDNPNVRFDEELDAVITLRDIKKGEELFSNYRTYDTEWVIKNKKMLNII